MIGRHPKNLFENDEREWKASELLADDEKIEVHKPEQNCWLWCAHNLRPRKTNYGELASSCPEVFLNLPPDPSQQARSAVSKAAVAAKKIRLEAAARELSLQPPGTRLCRNAGRGKSLSLTLPALKEGGLCDQFLLLRQPEMPALLSWYSLGLGSHLLLDAIFCKRCRAQDSWRWRCCCRGHRGREGGSRQS